MFQISDGRVEFTKWFTQEFRAVKFPAAGTVFDYFIEAYQPNPDDAPVRKTDKQQMPKFQPWTDKVPPFELEADIPLQV